MNFISVEDAYGTKYVISLDQMRYLVSVNHDFSDLYMTCSKEPIRVRMSYERFAQLLSQAHGKPAEDKP